MTRIRQAMCLGKCVISAALLIASMASANLYAGTITFPVGTPIGFSMDLFGFVRTVERDGFEFQMRNGFLGINANNIDGAHPDGGGLLVAHGEEQPLIIDRLDGQPFGLQSASILESNGITGLRLTVSAVHHETGVFFEHEFSFDLNNTTYDTLDFAAADPRFLSVRYIRFESLESPFLDPSETNYIIDYLTIVNEPADFDNDGNVDRDDLPVWEAAFGAGTGADADGDGDSDGADFLAWQQQFSPISAAQAVPEPASLWLLGLVSLIQLSNRPIRIARLLV